MLSCETGHLKVDPFPEDRAWFWVFSHLSLQALEGHCALTTQWGSYSNSDISLHIVVQLMGSRTELCLWPSECSVCAKDVDPPLYKDGIPGPLWTPHMRWSPASLWQPPILVEH